MSESFSYDSEGFNFEELSGIIYTNPEERIVENFYNELLPIIVEKWVEDGEELSEEIMLDSKSSDSSAKSYFLRNVEVKFKNGNFYSGTALGKRLNGKGEFKWKDGTSYKGSFNKNRLIGKGTFSYSNYAHYSGEVCYGHRHGKGCYITEQFKYFGTFFGALFHGPGILQADIHSFDGEFLCHKPYFGTRTYDNGVFAGVFDDFGSRKCGKFLFKNNDCYEGYWYEDQFNDFGIYKWNTRLKFVNQLLIFETPIYTGYWLDGQRHGIGMLEFDERIIFCNWENDKKTGPGLIMAASGDLYVSDEMFFRDQYKVGQKVIRLKEAKPLIENLLYFFFPKDQEYGCCKCCRKPRNALLVTHTEILREKIKELMNFATVEYDHLLPIFLPKYAIDFTNLIVLKFVKQTFQTCQEKDTSALEIKSINQVVVDNLKNIEMLYKMYATFGLYVQRNDVTLSRLGLWQMYSDIFEKMPEVIVSDLIDEVEYACNIFVRDSQNPCEKVHFWKFLRHLLYIVMKLNENALVRLKTMQDHYSFFGYFGTMLTVFLREFQSKEKLTFKRSIFMIQEQSKLALQLLEKMKLFEIDPTIRTVFRFYKQNSNAESKDEEKGNLKLIDNTLFVQCAQDIFPNLMHDGYFVDINFRITLLQFLEILLKLFETDIFQRKLKDAIELEKMRVRIEIMEQEEEAVDSGISN